MINIFFLLFLLFHECAIALRNFSPIEMQSKFGILRPTSSSYVQKFRQTTILHHISLDGLFLFSKFQTEALQDKPIWLHFNRAKGFNSMLAYCILYYKLYCYELCMTSMSRVFLYVKLCILLKFCIYNLFSLLTTYVIAKILNTQQMIVDKCSGQMSNLQLKPKLIYRKYCCEWGM